MPLDSISLGLIKAIKLKYNDQLTSLNLSSNSKYQERWKIFAVQNQKFLLSDCFLSLL